jgi:uncharacterized DUF497 family protein
MNKGKKRIKNSSLKGIFDGKTILWDNGNRKHFEIDNASREITIAEVEAVLKDPRTLHILRKVDEKTGENMFRAIGFTIKNRILAIGYTIREGKLRPATAFNANKQARRKLYLHLDSLQNG